MPEQTDHPLLSDDETARLTAREENDIFRGPQYRDGFIRGMRVCRDIYEQARKQDKERIRELEEEWIPVTENCQPERNSTAIYWHKGIDKDNPIRTGFPAVADEWRWEYYGKRATHFLKYDPPTKP